MRRLIHISLFMICLALCISCKRHGVVQLRLVATSDVHGNIFREDCLNVKERDGSLAKFASFIRKQRASNRNVIYIDAGDNLQGSVEAYQDLSAQLHRQSVVAEAFNELGCSASVLGNHDLAADGGGCDRFLRDAGFPVLAANVFFERFGDYTPPYTILEVQGLRVAILGMTTPVAKYTLPWDNIREIEIRDLIETAGYWMPILRDEEKADVIVGLIHSGLDSGCMDDEGVYENQVSALVRKVPGFDVIVYGHDHLPACMKTADCNGDSVLLINPGPFVRNAAVIDIKADFRGSDKPGILTSGYLQDITCENPDRTFMKKMSGWYEDVKNYSDSIIGTAAVPLEGAGVLWRESTAMDYVHSLQLKFNGADISLSSPLFTGTLIPAGDLRIRDLFSLYQYENSMVSVMLKGSEVRDILEYSASQFYNTVSDGSGTLLKTVTDADGNKRLRVPLKALITAAGIDYVIDVTKPEGERVSVISMTGGKPFDPDRLYRTTINSFLYAGTGSGSLLFRYVGLRHKEMKERLNSSSLSDIRYRIITDFATRKEGGLRVNVRRFSNWKLIPGQTVADCLARDTVQLNIIEN